MLLQLKLNMWQDYPRPDSYGLDSINSLGSLTLWRKGLRARLLENLRCFRTHTKRTPISYSCVLRRIHLEVATGTGKPVSKTHCRLQQMLPRTSFASVTSKKGGPAPLIAAKKVECHSFRPQIGGSILAVHGGLSPSLHHLDQAGDGNTLVVVFHCGDGGKMLID